MARRVALSGFDMTLNGHIGLNLFRDGRRPAVQGGRFSPTESMRSPGGLEQSVMLDRLDGGVGAVERLVPHTYPLAIDGCTRFSRAWTPGGEITHLPSLPPIPIPPYGPEDVRTPGPIRATLTWRDTLIVAAGGCIYQFFGPYYDLPQIMGTVGKSENVVDLLEFEGVLVASTEDFLSAPAGAPSSALRPGRLWAWDELENAWVGSPVGQTAYRKHLVKAYQVINGVGAWRLIGTNTLTSFKWIATGDDLAVTRTLILDDSAWAGGDGYAVGERSAPITNLAGAPLIMFFCKTDGVYHMGPDGRAARIVDWSDSEHPSNGEVFYFAYGGLYCSHVRWGLVRVDVANLQVQWQTNACAPGANLPRVVPSSGRVTAFCMDGEWLVAPVFNGIDSYTFYGRPNEITERTAMINLQSPQSLNWHGSEATFWNKRVTVVHQATIGPYDRPLLWVGWTVVNPPYLGHPEGNPTVPPHGTVGMSHVSLPKYGTPLEDWKMGGPHRFARKSWLYFPRQDWGDERGGVYSGWASVRKVFSRLDLYAEYLERYVTWIDAWMASEGGHHLFFDRADRYNEAGELDSMWTPVGRFDEGSRTSMVPGKAIQSGLKASLMLVGHCENDKPFSFGGAKLRGSPLLEQSERRQYRTVLGRTRKANQAMDHQERLGTLNEMWALQWADPVVLIDHLGQELVVDIDPTMSYEDVIEPNTQEPSTVVTWSCRIVRRPFVWGSGFRWGTDIVWSGPRTFSGVQA
jgi:hypothetical protein